MASRIVVDGEWVSHESVDGSWVDWYVVEGEL